MVAPGYGANDLALIVKIIHKIYHTYTTSPDHFRALSQECLMLETAIKQAIRSAPNEQLREDQQVQFSCLMASSKEILQKLYDVLEKYNTLATNKYSVRDRLLFITVDVDDLRARMHSQATSLQGFRQGVIGSVWIRLCLD